MEPMHVYEVQRGDSSCYRSGVRKKKESECHRYLSPRVVAGHAHVRPSLLVSPTARQVQIPKLPRLLVNLTDEVLMVVHIAKRANPKQDAILGMVLSSVQERADAI